MAPHPILDHEQGPGLRRKRTQVVGLYTDPPPGAVVVCADELGPVTPRTFPPAPAWSPDGHRIKASLEYFRGPDKTWVYGALRVADGTAVTMTASSRNSFFYQRFLQQVEEANPGENDIWVIADNLSSHDSLATRTWLADHPRIRHAFIPVGACWLNLQEAWWRIFRHHALAGVSFADGRDIDHATRIATAQLNQRAKPWVWGRPPPAPRHLRRQFTYSI
ncbi:transposase [Streptosporangium lutulentum]